MSAGIPKNFKGLEKIKNGVETAVNNEVKDDVARLYKNKSSRITKELSFKTKNDKSKLT
ncbi:hypothetical protein [Zobellia uliginosa]|uniref:hypothetical protein n=1 Tax=Zobellia uliginosa TaxID=143224 RepID=UPI001C06DE46|nr:hypothetical protein [Zobellia uliginosa]MBU2948599.1 hypothetical protein [Zobellia uliginosa]